jgi:hypothetical protein
MLCVKGLDRKRYWEQAGSGQPLPVVVCPDPSCESAVLRGHGSYQRFVDGILRGIFRLRCFRCGVTHALLPEDVCAYCDLGLQELEAAAASGQSGPSVWARSAGQPGALGVRRARRWRRGWRARWVLLLQGLLPAATGDLLERIWACVGAQAGALIRLRHWLWSSWRCFFGGLTGLYRHGRPVRARSAGSTELGSCPSPGLPP